MNIKKVLVANRGEIAIRVLRACTELDLQTVAIYTYEDRYSHHRYKADEAYQIGKDHPAAAALSGYGCHYSDRERKQCRCHSPGLRFLSENKEFSQRCKDNGIVFIGPRPEVMEALGR
jgi:pyruvate carboxylase